MGLHQRCRGRSCFLDVLLPLLLALVVVDADDDLVEGLLRDNAREPLELLQDKVGELKAVDCLKLDVYGVKPMPEVKLGDVVPNLSDA